MFKVILQTNLSIEVLNIFGHFVVLGNKHLIFILLYRELKMVFFRWHHQLTLVRLVYR